MIGMVYFSLLVKMIIGMNRLFQFVTNVKIACVAIAGFMIGKIMRLKV